MARVGAHSSARTGIAFTVAAMMFGDQQLGALARSLGVPYYGLFSPVAVDVSPGKFDSQNPNPVPSATPVGAQFPIEVRAVLDEARRRAAAQPADADALALELRQRVEAQYQERVVRMVYYIAACTQGMSPADADFYLRREVEGNRGQGRRGPAARSLGHVALLS